MCVRMLLALVNVLLQTSQVVAIVYTRVRPYLEHINGGVSPPFNLQGKIYQNSRSWDPTMPKKWIQLVARLLRATSRHAF